MQRISCDEDNPLYYRGDSRGPVDIFLNGFELTGSVSTINLRGHFDQSGLIGMSPNINAAAAFPISNDQLIWIYIVKPNQETLYDLHGESLKSFDNILECSLGEWAEEWCCTSKVNPENIIAAINIERFFLTLEGAKNLTESYKMVEVTLNQNASISLSENQISNFNNAIKNEEIHTTTAPTSSTAALDRMMQASIFLKSRDSLINDSHLSNKELKIEFNKLLNSAKKANRSGECYRINVGAGFFASWQSTFESNNKKKCYLEISEEKLNTNPSQLFTLFQFFSNHLRLEDVVNLSKTCKETQKFAVNGLTKEIERRL